MHFTVYYVCLEPLFNALQSESRLGGTLEALI